MERSASNTSVIARLARGGAIVALALGLTPLAGAQNATPDTATPGAGGDLIVASTDPAPVIPDPVAGEVTVVAYGPLDAFNIPVIVVNGTDKAVEDIEIAVNVGSSAATPAADAGGTPPADDGTPVAGDGVPDASVAVGEEGSPITGRGLSLFPDALEPGGVAIGAITFDGADVPADADLTFTVSSLAVHDSNIDEVDVTLSDVSFANGTFAGTATNDSNQDIVGSTNVRAVCQDADGNLTGYASAYLDQADLAQGDSVPFELTVPPTIDSCDAWLISAGGRNY